MPDTSTTATADEQLPSFEVTAWRPETYTVFDTFVAKTPEQALALAKAAFNEEAGESCLSCSAWDEFTVERDGEILLSESPESESPWGRIESAPRDGTPILVTVAGGAFHASKVEWRGTFWVVSEAPSIILLLDPTHWMPLPEPPPLA